jgi:chromosome segregation ATPase
MKERRAEAKTRAHQLAEDSKPMKQRTDAYEARAKETKRKVEEQGKAYDRLKAKIREQENTAGRFETAENDLRTEIRGIMKKAADRKAKLRTIAADIEKLERTVAKCQEKVDHIDPEREATLNNQIVEIGKERQALRPKVNQVNSEGRRYAEEKQSVQERLVSTQRRYPHFESGTDFSLTDLTSVAQRRMEILRARNHDAYEAVLWLQREGHKRFEHEIFGPPMLSVNIKDKSFAPHAEACFQQKDFFVPSLDF